MLPPSLLVLVSRYGRRTTFILALMLSIPLGIAVALALNYIMFVLMRLLFGAMLAGTFVSLYVAREWLLCIPAGKTGPGSLYWEVGLLGPLRRIGSQMLSNASWRGSLQKAW